MLMVSKKIEEVQEVRGNLWNHLLPAAMNREG
jgi:hypothetical protein